MKKAILSLCSGLIGVLLTIGYQHFFEQPQSFTIVIKGEEVVVTETDFLELSQQNEELQNQLAQINAEYQRLESINAELITNKNTAIIQSNQEIDTLEREIEVLKEQIGSMPIVLFSDLGLCIDGVDEIINTNGSLAMIDGKEYWNREVVEKFIPNNKSVTIKDNMIFIGRVISKKANLFDQYTMDECDFKMVDSSKDSYGNTYSNSLVGYGSYNGYRIYNTKREYSYLKCKIAPSANFSMSSKAVVTILADDEVIYTSDEIIKTTEPFEINDLPINNCLRIKIQVNGNLNSNVIVSNAILYN